VPAFLPLWSKSAGLAAGRRRHWGGGLGGDHAGELEEGRAQLKENCIDRANLVFVEVAGRFGLHHAEQIDGLPRAEDVDARSLTFRSSRAHLHHGREVKLLDEVLEADLFGSGRSRILGANQSIQALSGLVVGQFLEAGFLISWRGRKLRLVEEFGVCVFEDRVIELLIRKRRLDKRGAGHRSSFRLCDSHRAAVGLGAGFASESAAGVATASVSGASSPRNLRRSTTVNFGVSLMRSLLRAVGPKSIATLTLVGFAQQRFGCGVEDSGRSASIGQRPVADLCIGANHTDGKEAGSAADF